MATRRLPTLYVQCKARAPYAVHILEQAALAEQSGVRVVVQIVPEFRRWDSTPGAAFLSSFVQGKTMPSRDVTPNGRETPRSR